MSANNATTSASHVSLCNSDAAVLSHSASQSLRHSVSLSERIEAAIRRCLPGKYDKIERLLFKMAREWKAIASDADGEITTHEFVRRWFNAGGKELEESFSVVWLVFLDCFDRVRLPKGTSPAELAFERAKSNPLPRAARQYDDHRVQLLVAYCRELQILNGPHPFHLSCRMAGDRIGESKDLANALLHGLSRDGVLEEIVKGSISARGKLATRWRFIAPLD